MLAPSDFSALKNFVRKPVHHENCSKFFQWFKITSNQLTVNDVICDVVFVNNNTANSLLINFDCPVDRPTSSSKTARQHTQLVPRRTCSKPTAQISLPKTSGLQIHPTEPLGLPCLGAMLEAYHKRHPKTIAELKEVLQVIWDSLYSGTNRQSCQRVLKATEGLYCSWG